MGKPTGFIDYQRQDAIDVAAGTRVANDEYFHLELDDACRREQAGRCMDCGVPFCQAGMKIGRKLLGCPLRNLIPEWNDQLWRGSVPRALERLTLTNPFPEFTGYVCPAPCEGSCAAAKVNAPVTINANERYIIEKAFALGLMTPAVPARRSGLSVAVVGSGPAGLTVATLLNQRGHDVTVYERDAMPGGLLTYGIPNMKLPKSVIERRVALLEAEGITFACGVDVGRDVELDELVGRYDAVALAIGSQEPRQVAFAGEARGVSFALDYLKAAAQAHLGEAAVPVQLDAAGKVVVVVGAGDSANDCIATAIRQGATDVVQLIRRPAADYGPMTDYAHEEAAAVFDHDIRRFATKVASVEADEAGNLVRVNLDTDADQTCVEAGLLVIASGFSGPESYLSVPADEPKVFQAGDMATGSTLVVQAMAHARKVAAAIDASLVGYTSIR